MRKLLLATLALSILLGGVASAHQPVLLLDTDTTADRGPLLLDGTVSFALRAAFSKPGEKKAFRAQFKDGDLLSVQYLILDKKPENLLRSTALPTVAITGPSGFKVTMKLNERTKFYEPFSKTNYIYLARYSKKVVAGIYSFVISAKGKTEITIAVGVNEIKGEVLRGVFTPVKPTPTPTPSSSISVIGYTMAEVSANNNAKSCWVVIDGFVYNLTNWINAHPGGAGAITSLCGREVTEIFKAQHANQVKPALKLESYRLGQLQK